MTNTSNTDIMAIGCHPDDLEVGMGGTIARFTQAGKKVVLVDLTNGEPTPMGSPEIRAREAALAAKHLGVETRITLPIKNREILDTIENRKIVAEVIRQFRPKVLFVHYWDDGHPDHVQASALCDAARFYAKLSNSDMAHEPFHPKRVFYFQSNHLRLVVPPSFVFDVSEAMEAKRNALLAYESQFIKNEKNAGVIERLLDENRFWGWKIGTTAGEPFHCKEVLRLSSPDTLLSL